MKTFKNFLFENSLHHLQGAGLSSSTVPHDITDEEVKMKVNAILGHAATQEFMNREAAIGQMEAKLGQLGMARKNAPTQNQENPVEEESFSGTGEFMIEFSRYGETFGKSVDTPHDEFEKEEQVVSLKVKYEQLETGTFKVYGSLV